MIKAWAKKAENTFADVGRNENQVATSNKQKENSIICPLFTNTARTIYPESSAITTHPELENIWVASVSGKISVYSTNLELQIDWSAHESKITALLCVKPRILRNTTIWSGDDKGTLRVWDVADENSMKQEWKPFSRTCSIDIFCLFTGRGSKVWLGSKTESELSVFDTDSVQLLHILRLDRKQTPTTIAQTRDTVWVGTNAGNINIYSATSLLLLSWAAHPGEITGICPTTDETVWTCCTEGNFSMWNFKTKKIEALRTVELNQPLHSMISLPKLNAVWCLSESGAITIWTANHGTPIQEIPADDIIEQGTSLYPFCGLQHDNFVVVMGGLTISTWSPK